MTNTEPSGSDPYWIEFDRHAANAAPKYSMVPASASLRDAGLPWLHIHSNFILSEAAVLALIKLDSGTPTHYVAIQGRRSRTRTDLANAWGDALEFPSYYGRNMSAFDECFRDLLDLSDGGLGSAFGGRAGRNVKRLVLIVNEADHVLIDDPAEGPPGYRHLGPPGFVQHLGRLYAQANEYSDSLCELRVVYVPSRHSDVDQLATQIASIKDSD